MNVQEAPLYYSVTKQSNSEILWEDGEIKFDVKKSYLCLRNGEKLIQNIQKIEDTKGNPGKWGELQITNLRVIWKSCNNYKLNLSIGFRTIVGIHTKKTNSKLSGSCVSVCISTKTRNNNRFEFIFTDSSKESTSLYSVLTSIHKAYDTSSLFRELKLRGALIYQGQIRLLPKEEVLENINGVWNLSSEQGNLGSFFITTFRVVWFSSMNENYNVSIPYLQISTVKVRDSKFGTALVIESSWRSGGYVLGFRIDPEDKVRTVAKEITKKIHLFMKSPVFGVQFSVESDKKETSSLSNKKTDSERSSIKEDVEIDTSIKNDACVAYFAQNCFDTIELKTNERLSPVFCPELGLAIEPLQNDTTIESLWKLF